jgi:hypothetical protein
MSRPAPLEIHVMNPAYPGGKHFATLYDGDRGRVLFTAQGSGHDAAVEQLLTRKRYSRVSRRRYVVKSNRPAAVVGLLELIDKAEFTVDADDDTEAVHVALPMEGFLRRVQAAVTAIEPGSTFPPT